MLEPKVLRKHCLVSAAGSEINFNTRNCFSSIATSSMYGYGPRQGFFIFQSLRGKLLSIILSVLAHRDEQIGFLSNLAICPRV